MEYKDLIAFCKKRLYTPAERVCLEYVLFRRDKIPDKLPDKVLFDKEYCMEHIQNDYVRSIIGPPFRLKGWRKYYTEAQFQQYLNVIKSISPLAEESINSFPVSFEQPFIYVGSGHAKINYMLMMFWRYLWMNPKFVHLVLYLDDLGFKWYEIIMLSGMYSTLWFEHKIEPFVQSETPGLDKTSLQKLKGLISEEYTSKNISFSKALKGEEYSNYWKAYAKLSWYQLSNRTVTAALREKHPYYSLNTLIPVAIEDLNSKDVLKQKLSFFQMED